MLLNDGTASSPDIKPIDLQRVLDFPWFRYRWKVKDLASVHYSFNELGLTRTDFFEFSKPIELNGSTIDVSYVRCAINPGASCA
jgi:hypothetical protein